jgi:protein-S-isoprenylcysteine O-methyltransferase Ste14
MALQEEFEKQGNFLFIYRSYLPLIILVVGAALYVQTELNPEIFILKNTPYEVYYEMFALFVGLVGLGVRIYTVGHTPKNTSGRNTTEGQVADSLNTTGIYSTVRHPLYVGNFLMWLAPAMLTGNFWFIVAFCLLYWVYYERIMFAEEQFLRRKFGDSYLKWSDNVNAFLPSFKNFTKPNMPFSWKKVLKKEKNGLFALFLIFCAFDVAGELIKGELNFNYFLIAMCVLTGLSYIILKILKNNTNVLHEADR